MEYMLHFYIFTPIIKKAFTVLSRIVLCNHWPPPLILFKIQIGEGRWSVFKKIFLAPAGQFYPLLQCSFIKIREIPPLLCTSFILVSHLRFEAWKCQRHTGGWGTIKLTKVKILQLKNNALPSGLGHWFRNLGGLKNVIKTSFFWFLDIW